MRSVLLALLLCVSAQAGELKIAGKTEVEPYRLVRLKADGTEASKGFRWKVTPLTKPDAVVDYGDGGRNRKSIEFVAPPGKYKVELTVGRVVGADVEFEDAEIQVTVGGGKAPDPVVPPKPDGDSPLGNDKLRVLVVIDNDAKRGSPEALTPDQAAALWGDEVRTFLDTNAREEYRIWDKSISPVGDKQVWKDAMARPRKSHPWMIVSGPKGWYEGPLSRTKAEFLAKLKEAQ